MVVVVFGEVNPLYRWIKRDRRRHETILQQLVNYRTRERMTDSIINHFGGGAWEVLRCVALECFDCCDIIYIPPTIADAPRRIRILNYILHDTQVGTYIVYIAKRCSTKGDNYYILLLIHLEEGYSRRLG